MNWEEQINELEAMPVYGNHYQDSRAFSKADEIICGDGPMEIKFRALKHIDKLVGIDRIADEAAVAHHIEQSNC